MNAAETKARRLIASRTLAQLLTDWDLTEGAPFSLELSIIRGWLMDELKARDPLAYDAWLDDENPEASPRDYFKA